MTSLKELEERSENLELNNHVYELALASIPADTKDVFRAYLIGYIFQYVASEKFSIACMKAIDFVKMEKGVTK